MGKTLINLTRKFLPALSSNRKVNLENLNNMPEMVLANLRRQGDKSILYVDMNHCGAAIIKKGGINTVYTDALCGCNSVGANIKLETGDSLFMLSHYVPTNIDGQVEALKKQLETYRQYFSKNQTPRLFFNLRGQVVNGEIKITENPIIEKVKNLFSHFFNNNSQATITPYPNKNRPAFFSSANIYQFDPNDLNKLKITNVGEKESFINLSI